MDTTSLGDLKAIINNWAYAFGRPTTQGLIKQSPEDFRVIENLGVEPEGAGEHIWLKITKRQQNTDTVAKSLAKYVNVAYRDVGYSGQKDFHAVTQQWFSIYLPKESSVDWTGFSLSGVVIDQVSRHVRKIKRGTHQSNSFEIVIRNLSNDDSELSERLALIDNKGVPNYFGEQRFGRECRNINQAYSLLVERKRFKERNLKSLLYSSARSWCFNCIVSKRIETKSWNTLFHSEPVNLNGTASIFQADGDVNQESRLVELDIHPTAPMWGKHTTQTIEEYAELHQFEADALQAYKPLCIGLEAAGLKYQRRPIRFQANNLEYTFFENNLRLSFDLSKGQFATSVLRELINVIA